MNLCDLASEAHAGINLAYYFAYDYKVPQDVARYADPLVKRVHAWKTTWKQLMYN